MPLTGPSPLVLYMIIKCKTKECHSTICETNKKGLFRKSHTKNT